MHQVPLLHFFFFFVSANAVGLSRVCSFEKEPFSVSSVDLRGSRRLFLLCTALLLLGEATWVFLNVFLQAQVKQTGVVTLLKPIQFPIFQSFLRS